MGLSNMYDLLYDFVWLMPSFVQYYDFIALLIIESPSTEIKAAVHIEIVGWYTDGVVSKLMEMLMWNGFDCFRCDTKSNLRSTVIKNNSFKV